MHEPETADVATPGTAAELAGVMTRASTAGLKVLPIGQGTRMESGALPARVDLVLETTALSRIVHYEPADLTVTVEAGCGLEDLNRTLGEKGQILPVQARRRGGSVGGLLATGAEGNAMLAYGTARDRLTGLRAALADGSLVRGGGRVVKNVAGYPLHRLMAGSFGTLGVIVEASFQVHPRPEREATALARFASITNAFEAALLVHESGTEPVFANVLIETTGVHLAVGFDGFESRVTAHLKALGDIIAPARPEEIRLLSNEEQDVLRWRLDDPASWGRDAHGSNPLESAAPSASFPRDTRSELSAQNAPPHFLGGTLRLTAPPAMIKTLLERVLAVAEAEVQAQGVGAGTNGQFEQGDRKRPLPLSETAALPISPVSFFLQSTPPPAPEAGLWISIDARPGLGSAYLSVRAADSSAAIRTIAAVLASGRGMGHAVIVSAPAKIRSAIDPWGPLPPEFSLMKKIKQALDPAGLFATGRFVGGL